MVTIDEVLGKSVMGTADQYIGDVNNIDIDAKTWQITYLHVKLSGQAAKVFGVKKTLKGYDIRIPTSLVKKIDVIITLNQSLLELKESLALSNHQLDS